MIRKHAVIKWAFVSQLFFVLLCLSGCNSFTSFNSKAQNEPGNNPKPIRATINNIYDGDKHRNSLVILALSGGGSRAAYWSASVMFKLGDLLKEVDVISSVSGGSLPAAYYATSVDSELNKPNRVWNEDSVKELMSRQYLTQWGWNLFQPITFFKVNFTNYDKTDVMAQTLADNLFYNPDTDMNLQFRDMNLERPYLIINATRANITQKLDIAESCKSSNNIVSDKTFGEVFTFTEESFSEIESDLASYDISKAVMASATFPGLYNDMTLQDFRQSDGGECKRYIHLVDGGNVDNLGLRTVRKIIDKNKEKYNNIIVILIDSYADIGGWSSGEDNPRKYQGWGLDPNIMHAIDSLLSSTRENEIKETIDTLKTFVNEDVVNKKSIFYHIEFKDVGFNKDLFARLNKIPTSFNLEEEHVKSLDKATELLFGAHLKENMDIKEVKNTCLKDIADLVWHNHASKDYNFCKFQNANEKN